MADYGLVLAAIDEANDSDLLGAYVTASRRAMAESVEGDPVAMAVIKLMDRNETWHGSATKLLETITPDKVPRDWPSTPSHLSARLKRAAPSLSNLGIAIDFGRTGSRRDRFVHLENLPDAMQAEQASPSNNTDAADGADDPSETGAEFNRSDPSPTNEAPHAVSAGTDENDAGLRHDSEESGTDVNE